MITGLKHSVKQYCKHEHFTIKCENLNILKKKQQIKGVVGNIPYIIIKYLLISKYWPLLPIHLQGFNIVCCGEFQ